MKQIAIFASGSGTNAQAIIEHFEANNSARVALVLSNKPDAYVLSRAKKHDIKTYVFTIKTLRENPEQIIEVLERHKIDLIVLAGFMALIPELMVEKYPHRIVNIHPALLPAYGGKGMYGDAVHQAVIQGGESQSGITIHYVDQHYDSGGIIFQTTTPVLTHDTPQTLAHKIHQLEYKYYAQVIEQLCNQEQ